MRSIIILLAGYFMIVGFSVLEKVENKRVEISNTPQPLSIHIPYVYFKKGSYELDPVYHSFLDTMAMFLNENSKIITHIIGYSDSRGDLNYNFKLSKKRAKSVANYLRQKGIKKSRLELKWYGETRLLNLCSDTIECSEEMHQINRRVEFIFVFPEDSK
jgi:outer membrane protein OmpA-like peptidoglycan-associated protein